MQSDVLYEGCGDDGGGEVRLEYGDGGAQAALDHYQADSIAVRSWQLMRLRLNPHCGDGGDDDD